MTLDRVPADGEHGGDLWVCIAVDNKLKKFRLPFRERLRHLFRLVLVRPFVPRIPMGLQLIRQQAGILLVLGEVIDMRGGFKDNHHNGRN